MSNLWVVYNHVKRIKQKPTINLHASVCLHYKILLCRNASRQYYFYRSGATEYPARDVVLDRVTRRQPVAHNYIDNSDIWGRTTISLSSNVAVLSWNFHTVCIKILKQNYSITACNTAPVLRKTL